MVLGGMSEAGRGCGRSPFGRGSALTFRTDPPGLAFLAGGTAKRVGVVSAIAAAIAASELQSLTELVAAELTAAELAAVVKTDLRLLLAELVVVVARVLLWGDEAISCIGVTSAAHLLRTLWFMPASKWLCSTLSR